MGEFDPNGDLMDPKDPYLYWLIPILKEPVPVIQPPQHQPFGPAIRHRDVSVADFLEIHRHLKTGRFKTAVDAIPDGKK